jgi:hypothetical protein
MKTSESAPAEEPLILTLLLTPLTKYLEAHKMNYSILLRPRTCSNVPILGYSSVTFI